MIDPLDYLAEVHKNVRQMSRSLPWYVDRDDIMAAGMLGLCEAADRYDETTMVPFRTFARWRIRGAVVDHLRKASNSNRQRAEPDFLSLDKQYDDARDYEHSDDVQYQPEAQLAVVEDSHLLAEAIDELPERDQIVVRGFYAHRTGVDIAEELGLTQGRISQMRSLAFRQLRSRLRAA